MRTLIFLLLLFLSLLLFAEEGNQSQSNGFFASAYQRLKQVWNEGSMDLYLSGYAWHNRYTYSPERVKLYNETAWGGGLGKSLFDKKGNWHSLYAIAFLESHGRLQPTIGYCFLKVLHLRPHLGAGIGYSIFLTSRPDILNRIPIPGILPWASIFYKRAAISAAYIPGTRNTGNVLFIIGRLNFT